MTGLLRRAPANDHWYAAGLHTTQTLVDALQDGAARHPQSLMIFDSETHPASARLIDIHRRGARLAGAFARLGLRPGDVIACQVPNWLEGAVVYHAAISLGLVLVPVVHIYGPVEVGYILRQSGARALVMPDRWRTIDYLDRFATVGDCPDLEHVITIGERTAPGGVTLAALEALDADPPAPPALHADDVCMVIYTSGTTSAPKGVQHTHNTLLAEMRALADADAGTPDAVHLSPFPAGHMGGVLLLGRAFLSGRTSILVDSWNTARVARVIRERGVSWLGATPFFLSSLLADVRDTGAPMPSLDEIHLGGAGVPPELVLAAEAAGWRAFRSYGSTEHPTVTVSAVSDPVEVRAYTDGVAFGANRLRIVDDDGLDLPPGTPGEVVTLGPELFVGYTDPTLNAEAFLDGGWFRTGDIGTLDEAGHLTIVDRKKDIIIRGGENISSTEVEGVLLRHPAIVEAAVTAMPDPLYGERVCAFVIVEPGRELSLRDLVEHFVAVGVAKHKTPERLEIVADLPRTAAGKVRKADLRARLRAPAPGPVPADAGRGSRDSQRAGH
ncbi:AMP-binding protein [Frankia sp. AvcI1]|uniref:AMP-binding protein n=1 Tax=Frankia sp. AvcI1 TaxID=573496 RepID=UPI0021181FA0|nr:AMP-binding protein [Frankia sp. AvcI1]